MIFDNREVGFAIDFANLMIKESGRLSPMVIGLTGEKRYVVACPFASDEEKYAMAKKIKGAFRELGVTAIVFMTEAWMKRMDKAEVDKCGEDNLPRPSLCPDRTECVIISYISENENIHAMMDMIRDGDKVTLSEPSIVVGDEVKDNIWGDMFTKRRK